MIVSENWLREWVDPDCRTPELVRRLTMAGLEVDRVSPVAGSFSGVVVGRVESVGPHPGADRLSLCVVDDGGGGRRVVCGARNVRAGMKAPLARPGAEIRAGDGSPGRTIEPAEIRGVRSEGMLCSAGELGLADGSDGVHELPGDAPAGKDVRELLGLDDVSISLDLTPNRGDCLGVAGVAREVGALFEKPVTRPDIRPVESRLAEELPVRVAAAEECPRYLGRIIRGVDLSAATPLWMRERLRRSGLRSIDPVVDVTNYVLLELGQPMHAFDRAKLAGRVEARLARPGEAITLLDGRRLDLADGTLVIADADGPVALAGVMGGRDTAVTARTRDVFFECACFSPRAVGGKARLYGLHTDASHRYERGVDHGLQRLAMERATRLLLDITGGEAGPVTEAVGRLPPPVEVGLRPDAVSRLLGTEIPRERIVDILTRLGFKVAEGADASLRVAAPSFRFDIAIEADLIEEVARVHGYDNIPPAPGPGAGAPSAPPEARVGLARMRERLAGLGYQEVVTYSFIDPALSALVAGPGVRPVGLRNPLSEDMSVMRPSLLPGLLSVLRYNANRRRGRLRLFESGTVFSGGGEGGVTQTAMLAGLACGSRFPAGWAGGGEATDFFDVKGDVEALLEMGGRAGRHRFEPGREAAFHPGRCARIRDEAGEPVGHVGALHPRIAREAGLDGDVHLFELRLEALRRGRLPRTAPLSRFPEVSRDVAVVVDRAVPARDILDAVRERAGDRLREARIFDVYQGDAVGDGEKSVALGLTWQHPSRTLEDDEISGIVAACIETLRERFGARLRG